MNQIFFIGINIITQFTFAPQNLNKHCREELNYQSDKSSITINYIKDSVDLFVINQKIFIQTIDSICGARILEDSLIHAKRVEFKSGYLSPEEYSNILMAFDHKDFLIGGHSLWYINYDTLSYKGKTYKLFRFDLSFDTTYNQHFCYSIVYIQGQFITTMICPLPSSYIEGESEIYYLSCNPLSDDATLLNKIQQKSMDVIDGSNFYSRKFPIIDEK